MTIYPNLFIPLPWDFITLYFPLKPLVYFGHCGKAQRSSYCILGALTLTRPICATSVTCQGLTPSLMQVPHFVTIVNNVPQKRLFSDIEIIGTKALNKWFSKPCKGSIPSNLFWFYSQIRSCFNQKSPCQALYSMPSKNPDISN